MQDEAVGSSLAAEKCSLSVRVCSRGIWPSFSGVSAASLRLSPPFSSLKDIFLTFYTAHAVGKKLLLLPSLGSCEVKAKLRKQPKETAVSNSSSSSFFISGVRSSREAVGFRV